MIIIIISPSSRHPRRRHQHCSATIGEEFSVTALRFRNSLPTQLRRKICVPKSRYSVHSTVDPGSGPATVGIVSVATPTKIHCWILVYDVTYN